MNFQRPRYLEPIENRVKQVLNYTGANDVLFCRADEDEIRCICTVHLIEIFLLRIKSIKNKSKEGKF